MTANTRTAVRIDGYNFVDEILCERYYIIFHERLCRRFYKHARITVIKLENIYHLLIGLTHAYRVPVIIYSTSHLYRYSLF